MIATTPSGTRTCWISSPLGRRQPSSTSPTGSGSAGDLAQAGGHALDAGVGEPQAVERAGFHAGGGGGVEVGGVGGEELGGALDEQVGGGEQGGVLLGGGRRRPAPAAAASRPPAQLGHGRRRGACGGESRPRAGRPTRVLRSCGRAEFGSG